MDKRSNSRTMGSRFLIAFLLVCKSKVEYFIHNDEADRSRLIAAPTCKAFASANPAFGTASENSGLIKLINKLITFLEIKIKLLKERFEETPEDSWDIWHRGNI